MNIAENLARSAYRKSASPDAVENRNDDWQAGFVVGRALEFAADVDRSAAMEWEFDARGRPDTRGPDRDAWNEWKRGFWSGVWTSVDDVVDSITVEFNELET